MVTAYLGLGSNLGDRQGNLVRAVELLSHKMKIERLSSIYETEPVGYLHQPHFLNAVCQVSTKLSPQELFHLAKEIESDLGRVPSFPNAPRTVDIDILFYDNQVVQTLELTIPHPQLTERAFVLVPLAEIAPDLTHPVSGAKITELLGKVKGQEGVQRCTRFPFSNILMPPIT